MTVLYQCTYREYYVERNDRSSTATYSVLQKHLMTSMTEAEWEKVCPAFAKFFGRGNPHTHCPTTPQPLQPMFTFMKCNKHRNLFGNGTGKLFLFQLLSLTPLGPYVRVGTTRNPSTDWCGVQVRRISGVVDLVVASEGKWVIVGEVKGSGAGSFNQIIATMHAVTAGEMAMW